MKNGTTSKEAELVVITPGPSYGGMGGDLQCPETPPRTSRRSVQLHLRFSKPRNPVLPCLPKWQKKASQPEFTAYASENSLCYNTSVQFTAEDEKGRRNHFVDWKIR
jgi:hypothetical protein